MLINRSLRNLLHAFNRANSHRVNKSDITEEMFGDMSLLKKCKWDPQLTSIYCKLDGAKQLDSGEDMLLSRILSKYIERLDESNPTDSEKIYAYIELLQRKNEMQLAGQMQSAFSVIRRNDGALPGFRIL